MAKAKDRITKDRDARGQSLEAVAGNGLIDRRALLGRGVVFAGAMGAGIGPARRTAHRGSMEP